MQLLNNIKSFGVLALSLSGTAFAGEDFVHFPADTNPVVEEHDGHAGWCDALKSIGKLYKNSENPIVQEFSVFGRFHYQAAYIDGQDTNNSNFSEDFDELRRFRIGAKAKIFQYFDVLARINISDDDRETGGDLDVFEYQNFDEALIGFDIKKAFGLDQFDKLHLSYGRHKFAISHEAVTSSKQLLTVERAGISNKVFGSFRPTGAKLKWEAGDWDGLIGVYSTEEDDEFVAGWSEAVAYQVRVGHQFNSDFHMSADFVFNDDDNDNPNQLWEYHWAASVSGQYDNGTWGIAFDLIYGDNGDESIQSNSESEGDFWGIVILPHYWLIKDKLQAVARYSYQGSERDEGIEIGSRYLARTDDTNANINGGLGDQHHSYYVGLNYHICDHNAKILAGIEYDDLNTPAGGVEGFTYWLSFRTHF